MCMCVYVCICVQLIQSDMYPLTTHIHTYSHNIHTHIHTKHTSTHTHTHPSKTHPSNTQPHTHPFSTHPHTYTCTAPARRRRSVEVETRCCELFKASRTSERSREPTRIVGHFQQIFFANSLNTFRTIYITLEL